MWLPKTEKKTLNWCVESKENTCTFVFQTMFIGPILPLTHNYMEFWFVVIHLQIVNGDRRRSTQQPSP
ncbi:hypothetical protein L2E82_08869 [Cichorium intybus]|uniref:Uncharacterized protein n=1 Tax=Cichorium intybus TaxID=13427 RepID=A0ACB9G711_CICIN|nr:hypothetical protein L2E82_08869 [Cichorium intybus]